MITTGAQIRAARALLGWTRTDLAAAAGLHPNAVAYWERAPRIPPPLRSGRAQGEPVGCGRIREALDRVGVTFIVKPGIGAVFMP